MSSSRSSSGDLRWPVGRPVESYMKYHGADGLEAESDAAAVDALYAVVVMHDALTFGNKRHGVGAWKHHPDVDWRLAEKLIRHLVRYFMAPTANDVDSGLHHLAHVLSDAALLFEQARMRGHVVYDSQTEGEGRREPTIRQEEEQEEEREEADAGGQGEGMGQMHEPGGPVHPDGAPDPEGTG